MVVDFASELDNYPTNFTLNEFLRASSVVFANLMVHYKSEHNAFKQFVKLFLNIRSWFDDDEKLLYALWV